MSSLDIGKAEAVEWVKANFKQGDTCLDVGACDGKWSRLLGAYLTMSAVEVFRLNIITHQLTSKYKAVHNVDMRDFTYDYYDLIIFGDVLEHMTVEQAQKVIEYAKPRCKDMLIGVPYQWHQDAIYGNPYEKHIQEDLTHEIFMQRYKGLKPLALFGNYGYYIKDERR